jgi:DNA-binding transcriptional LysR family regulator
MISAGAELLARSKVILDEVAAAEAAVRRIAAGEAGTVRPGITPPVAPVLARTSSAGSPPTRRS